MGPYDVLAGMTQYAGVNFAYNLDFIPEDKLDWKPSPDANSALEVAAHVVHALNGMRPLLKGGGFNMDHGAGPTDLASAKAAVIEAASAFAEDLRNIDPAILGNSVETPVGAMPLGQVLTWGPFDLMHHHGQLAYIQTILGDKESHFAPMGGG
jgi:hypothetical protein